MLIDCELAYMNTNHEDFIGFAKWVKSLRDPFMVLSGSSYMSSVIYPCSYILRVLLDHSLHRVADADPVGLFRICSLCYP